MKNPNDSARQLSYPTYPAIGVIHRVATSCKWNLRAKSDNETFPSFEYFRKIIREFSCAESEAVLQQFFGNEITTFLNQQAQLRQAEEKRVSEVQASKNKQRKIAFFLILVIVAIGIGVGLSLKKKNKKTELKGDKTKMEKMSE